ncbi:MAG TPA: ATP-binding protein, partial [Jatrophihabitans sp.]|nr:ATP-binding protein [Jatrophihabitans sp.]
MRSGESRALVLRGEAGVGKSVLLEYLIGRATGCRVLRASGVQSEMELAFAGLHQLCAPILDRIDRLPGPQRDALNTALGLAAGGAPDRFLVGLGALGLLAEAADDRPLICAIDDAQWLDRASSQSLAFVARRLSAESVGMVFAARDADEAPELAGIPDVVVPGLAEEDARALLNLTDRGKVDPRVVDQIVAEAHGNPLALLELPKGLGRSQLAGGFGSPRMGALAGRIEESYQRQLAALPDDTCALLLVAAAEPIGDPVLMWRAAERLGIGISAAAPAEVAGLVELGARVRFQHPLLRSAVYRAAGADDICRAHAALALATDPAVDPERRAWHESEAAAGPDEDVAAELERLSERAAGRGGLAAAAAFLTRATE